MKRKIFKQLFLLSLVFFLSMVSAGNAYASGDKYKKLEGETKFTEIKENLVNSTNKLAHYKAGDAYRELSGALKDFKKLHETVEKTKNVDEVIEDVANGLADIAVTYDNVAKIGKDLVKFRDNNFKYLQSMTDETLKTAQQIARESSGLQEENKRLEKRLTGNIDDIERNDIQITIRGNTSIIKSLQGQAIIWSKFHEAQTNLLSKLQLNGRKVDSLIHILEVNARVYKEASNVAQLRRTAKTALDNLSSLGDIQSIIGDLQNSWLEVDDLVADISNADFTID
jgi:hypothetical protein